MSGVCEGLDQFLVQTRLVHMYSDDIQRHFVILPGSHNGDLFLKLPNLTSTCTMSNFEFCREVGRDPRIVYKLLFLWMIHCSWYVIIL